MSDEGSNQPQEAPPLPAPDASGTPVGSAPIQGEPTGLVQKGLDPIGGETTQTILGGGGGIERTVNVREGQVRGEPTRRTNLGE